ncbi:MAG: DinB family protein [Psychrobacillus sp.]
MTKDEILHAHQNYLRWLTFLEKMSEDEGNTPYGEGKWTPNEIVMHLAEWDKFTLQERLPLMKEGEKHQAYPNFEDFNTKAAALAHEQTFKETLAHAKKQREAIMAELQKIDEVEWDKYFYIGDHSSTIRNYFTDFIEHDLHHQKQITPEYNN